MFSVAREECKFLEKKQLSRLTIFDKVKFENFNYSSYHTVHRDGRNVTRFEVPELISFEQRRFRVLTFSSANKFREHEKHQRWSALLQNWSALIFAKSGLFRAGKLSDNRPWAGCFRKNERWNSAAQRWCLALKIFVFSAVQRFSVNKQHLKQTWNYSESELINQNVSETSTRVSSFPKVTKKPRSPEKISWNSIFSGAQLSNFEGYLRNSYSEMFSCDGFTVILFVFYIDYLVLFCAVVQFLCLLSKPSSVFFQFISWIWAVCLATLLNSDYRFNAERGKSSFRTLNTKIQTELNLRNSLS